MTTREALKIAIDCLAEDISIGRVHGTDHLETAKTILEKKLDKINMMCQGQKTRSSTIINDR